jgi:small conductance mechanosensitive channel
MDQTLGVFLSRVAYMLLLALVVVAAIQKLGVDTTSFAAIIAAAGLAIGFALQGSLSNFAAGVMIIALRPFKVGDYIEAGGVSGSVSAVSVFATELKTPDNKKVIVPNSAITSGNITNYSAEDTRRIDLVVGVGYGDDIGKAKGVLEGILAEDERILAEPKATVAVSELGASSVDFVVRPWVRAESYWPVKFDLTERIKNRLDEEGINIPYPQRDVHVYNVEPAKTV